MDVKFDSIILYVENPQLLKKFYVDNFNFKIIDEDEIWVLLESKNISIGLHKIGDEYLNKKNSNNSYTNNVKLIFTTDIDIQTARNQLISNHVKMREIKTFDNYPYWLCDGLDPEGNVFQLKSKKDKID